MQRVTVHTNLVHTHVSLQTARAAASFPEPPQAPAGYILHLLMPLGRSPADSVLQRTCCPALGCPAAPMPPTGPLPPTRTRHSSPAVAGPREGGVSAPLERARRMQGPAGRAGRAAQCRTHCWYLFFFLRSRENSLVFFLWDGRDVEAFIWGKCQIRGWPVPFPHQQPLCSEDSKRPQPLPPPEATRGPDPGRGPPPPQGLLASPLPGALERCRPTEHTSQRAGGGRSGAQRTRKEWVAGQWGLPGEEVTGPQNGPLCFQGVTRFHIPTSALRPATVQQEGAWPTCRPRMATTHRPPHPSWTPLLSPPGQAAAAQGGRCSWDLGPRPSL